MIAKWIRVVDEDGVPTGFVGLAVAADMFELWHVIDEFVSPYSVEIASVRRGGSLIAYQGLFDENLELLPTPEELRDDRPDISEDCPLPDAREWKRPKWKPFEYYYPPPPPKDEPQ